jgi:hypothetical protein
MKKKLVSFAWLGVPSLHTHFLINDSAVIGHATYVFESPNVRTQATQDVVLSGDFF